MSSPPSHLPLTGRWLHFGVEHREPHEPPAVYSEHEWDQACAQVAAWGLTGVHIKVAEGTYQWYDDAGLTMLKAIAQKHLLGIAPYHYVYGNFFGPYIQREAEIAATVGKHFGCYIPDMETQWEGHADWVQPFASFIRHYGYSGPIIPTTFANCIDHSRFPYREMNKYLAAAWMPQVYFDLWTQPGTSRPMTAQEAAEFVYRQWTMLDQICRTHDGRPLAPILPIIDVYKRPPVGEVVSWLTHMQGYGYCGFWYDGVYAPYADAIRHAPMPQLAVHPASPPVATHSNVVQPVVHAIQAIDQKVEQVVATIAPSAPAPHISDLPASTTTSTATPPAPAPAPAPAISDQETVLTPSVILPVPVSTPVVPEHLEEGQSSSPSSPISSSPSLPGVVPDQQPLHYILSFDLSQLVAMEVIGEKVLVIYQGEATRFIQANPSEQVIASVDSLLAATGGTVAAPVSTS